MKIIISPHAKKQFKKINKIDQIALARKIRLLPEENRNIKKLSGYRDIFRIRVGDYRIVYKKSPSQIYIILIGHRKDIYKFVNRFWN